MIYVYDITDEKISEAKKFIISVGGAVNSDDSFEMMGIKGYFKRKDDLIEVTITDKPWYVSWTLVESKLNRFFT